MDLGQRKEIWYLCKHNAEIFLLAQWVAGPLCIYKHFPFDESLMSIAAILVISLYFSSKKGQRESDKIYFIEQFHWKPIRVYSQNCLVNLAVVIYVRSRLSRLLFCNPYTHTWKPSLIFIMKLSTMMVMKCVTLRRLIINLIFTTITSTFSFHLFHTPESERIVFIEFCHITVMEWLC